VAINLGTARQAALLPERATAIIAAIRTLQTIEEQHL
jgi:hypothetical protein